MSIYVISLDADGCLFNKDFLKSEDKNVITHNQKLLNSIKENMKDVTKTIIMNGSNRQSNSMDVINCTLKTTPSWFKVLKEIETNLPPAVLDTFLMADIADDLPNGTSFTNAISENTQELTHTEWPCDDSKVSLLYAQMHKIAMENPDDSVVFDFIEIA